MSKKMDIYPYQRIGEPRINKKWALPSLPKPVVSKKMLLKALGWENLVLMLVAFLSGRALLAGGLLPFSGAFMGSVLLVFPKHSFSVLVAAIVGLATVTSGYVLYSSVIHLILLFLVLTRSSDLFYRKWYGVPLLIAGLTVIVKTGVYAYFKAEPFMYIGAVFEAVLSGCSSFLLVKTLPVVRRKEGLRIFKKEEIIGASIIIIILLTGLSELSFRGIELKNLFGRAFVLFASYAGGSSFGAAMGTLVGMVPSITTAAAPGMVAVHSFSGLMAGLFRGFGRVGVSIGFILGNVLLSIYLTEYSQLLMSFTETAIAVLFFLLIPSKHLYAIKTTIKNSVFTLTPKSFSDNRIREITSQKLREYSRIFSEISNSFEEISCDLKVNEETNLQNLFNGLATKVCKGCSLYRICWDKEFYKTYRSVMDMIAQVEINGRLTEGNVPEELKKRCARVKEFAITVNCLFELYKQSQIWQRKMVESRDIVAGQLRGISTIINNLANEIKIDVRMREDIERILRSELSQSGYNILDLSVIGEGKEDLEIKISCPSCGGKMECVNGICPLISKLLAQPFTVFNSNYCTKKTGDSVCEFKLMPMRVFKVETGYAAVAKDSNMVSGDSYSTLDLKDGKFAVILSDGMGVGPKAAAESKATITLLEKLLESGFEKNLAIKTVNSILVLGSPEDTFATVDLAVIDLMSGLAEFIKIGSAPSFIKRGTQVGVIRANSLPIGILNNIEVESLQQPMGHDDVLVMVSDGLLGIEGGEKEGESWIAETLKNIMTTDPQNVADLLLNKGIQKLGDDINDDMTVVALRLSSANYN